MQPRQLPPDKLPELHTAVEDVEGWLSEAEIELLFRLALDAAPLATIVEVGSWKGRSTIVLAKALETRGEGTVHAIDPHVSQYHEPGADTYDEFLSNLERKAVTDFVKPYRTKSLEVAADWSEPLGMVWIDGSHDYEDVHADIRTWSKFLVPGGVMAVHDVTTWAGPGRAVDELLVRSPHFVGHGIVHHTMFAWKSDAPRPLGQSIRARRVGLTRRLLAGGIRMHRFAPGWTVAWLRRAAHLVRRATIPRNHR